MRKIIFFLLSFQFACVALAQDNSLENYVSEYTYIYKLNKEDVYAIHVKKKSKQMKPYLHTLMDSVKTKNIATYSFSIGSYLYPGLYKLNPAKVSLMYFPALFGQEGLKKIRIVEK